MNKIKASVVVIGYQKEDNRMYPHLYDFLQNLRSAYDEVIYIDDDDRGLGLYRVDICLHDLLSMRGFRTLGIKVRGNILLYLNKLKVLLNRGRNKDVKDTGRDYSLDIPSFCTVGKELISMFKLFFLYFYKRNRLIKKVKNLHLKYKRNLIIAIDHTAGYIAGKYFLGSVVFWSFDIPTKDYEATYHMRIKNGFYEKLITSKNAIRADTLMIQDENRKELFEDSFGICFKNTIYLPAGLNDTEFCKKASEKRLNKNYFAAVTVIQIGEIGKHRYSNQLIDSYQRWPSHYKLILHGFVRNEIYDKLSKVGRKPHMSESIYDNISFPRFLNNHDIGFVGYGQHDNNHRYIENASSQLVAFLRLGMPVIACGSDLFNNFVNKNNIGIGIFSFEEIEAEIKKIVDNYAFFSRNARNLYESRFDLTHIFQSYLIKSFEAAGL